ncbi:MAG: hypothetical protein EOO57_19180 [Hymenobacter sp.]|nr:MAG: hypothetical protein EOO57_19180 [Hymenobacter sp.]
MSSNDKVKANIHWLVETIENPAVLAAVEVLLSQQIPPASLGLRDTIEQALRESEAGLSRPHEEVWPEICAKFGVQL